MTENKNVFEHLKNVKIDPKHIEEKNKLKYLSWSFAWQYVKTHYPDTSYKVREWDGKPYLFDEHLGYLVETSVTIQGETISMRLPVMDGSNKAQRHIQVKYTTKYGDKVIEQASMFDINTAIMRCLVKNLAMFGLGLSLYSGEDLPDDNTDNKSEDKTAKQDLKQTTNLPKPTVWLNEKDKSGKVTSEWEQVTKDIKDKKTTIAIVKTKYLLSKDVESKLNSL